MATSGRFKAGSGVGTAQEAEELPQRDQFEVPRPCAAGVPVLQRRPRSLSTSVCTTVNTSALFGAVAIAKAGDPDVSLKSSWAASTRPRVDPRRREGFGVRDAGRREISTGNST